MIEIAHDVTITDKADVTFNAYIFAAYHNNSTTLSMISSRINFMDIPGTDFLDCLTTLREELEEQGLFILCQGAAKNVRPSGMSRSMSNGLSAYRFEMGKKTSMEDLVYIFDPAPIEIVGTIAEQEDFFMQWLNNLRKLS
ncbi:hypothetical protein HQ865_23100 [Mucilaginibacter mali]|uniref:Uncharacterized protein n=1 Tax=Mucilaginibacter mali TaxID=2740462 RepID=A0A7D4QCS4_9SPHI|nr:hypothetical protein [Mucilaginibacter mali]QKJ32525.1 hypothetical protein HQ865_23100 [Mucilaginibacter mali]